MNRLVPSPRRRCRRWWAPARRDGQLFRATAYEGIRTRGKRMGAALFLAMFAGCAASPQSACLLPAQQPMVVAELFFGRAIRGRAPLSDAEWTEFAAQTITPNFPDGFTVLGGEGQWRNPLSGQIARERTKILLVAARPAPDLAQRLAAVIDAYKTRYHERSVGVITGGACAAF